jgi:hypothetical protein
VSLKIRVFPLFFGFFSAGLVGLIILLILPSANAVEETDPELYESRKKTGNIVGAVLLGVIIFIAVLISAFLGDNNEVVYQRDINRNVPEGINDDSDSSSATGDLMLKIIEKDIPTPMDSATAAQCLDLMQTSFELSQKITGPGGISDSEQGKLVGMSCLLVCENGIELFEESKAKLPKNLVNAFKEFKKRYNSE